MLLKERFGDAHGKLTEGLPESAAVCLEALAVLLGLFLFAPDGKRAVGRHPFRVSGARHLAYCGLVTRIIMLLARSVSKVILRYIKDTPLTRLADLYGADESASSSSMQQLLVRVISFNEKQIKAAEEMACEAQASVDGLVARVEALEKKQLNRGEPKLLTFVGSRGDDGCACKVVPDYLTEPPCCLGRRTVVRHMAMHISRAVQMSMTSLLRGGARNACLASALIIFDLEVLG